MAVPLPKIIRLRAPQRLLIWVSSLSVIFLLLFNFQNCGKARLFMVGGKGVGVSAQYFSLLPPPTGKDVNLRIVIVVDQSHSMKYGKCPGDLDSANPLAQVGPCTPPDGVDPAADRYKVIESWLSSLEIAASGEDSGEVIKVAILPFSGGIKQRPNNNSSQSPKDVDMMSGFLTLRDAKRWVEYLKTEQTNEPPNGLSKKMGTSAPMPVLDLAKTTFENEYRALQQTGELERTQFKFIFVSDGVLKPIDTLLQRALQLAQCPTDCQAICRTNQSPTVCTDTRPACVPDAGYIGGPSPFDYCNIHIPQRFSYAFGDFNQNKLSNISTVLTNISKLPETYNAGDLKLYLTQVYPTRVPQDGDQSSPVPNLYGKIVEAFASNPAFQTSIIDSPTPPFSVQPRNMGLVTYKIAKFYVVNLNAFIDEYGDFVVDSDGDGLSDSQEIKLGYSPNKPRSGKDGSKCLDSIDRLFGCEKQKPCDMGLDNDGDGLSQCDEITVKSNPELSDSDEDDLFDFFDVFRSGLSPNVNETRSFKSGDEFNDHQHFFAGVHPQIRLGFVKPENLVDTEVKFISLEKTQTLRGSIKVSSIYSVRLQNVPLVATVEVPTANVAPLKYSRGTVTRSIPTTDLLGPTAHAAGVNQLVFLVRVVATENAEDFYWLAYRKDLQLNGNLGEFKINLSDFQELKLLK